MSSTNGLPDKLPQPNTLEKISHICHTASYVTLAVAAVAIVTLFPPAAGLAGAAGALVLKLGLPVLSAKVVAFSFLGAYTIFSSAAMYFYSKSKATEHPLPSNKKEVEEAQKQVADLQGKLKKANEDLAAEKSQREAEAKAAAQTQKDASATLNKSLDEAKAALKKAQDAEVKANAALQKAQDETKASLKKAQEAEGRVSAADENANKALAAKTQAEQNISKVQTQLAQIQSEKQKLSAEVESLNAQIKAEKQKLNGEIENLKKQNKSEIQTHTAEIDSLNTKHQSEQQKLNGKISDLESQLAYFEDTKGVTDTEHQKVQAAIASAGKRQTTAEEAARTAKHQVSQLEEKLKKAEAELQKVRQSEANCKQELETCKSKIESLEDELKHANSELASVKKQFLAANQELAGAIQMEKAATIEKNALLGELKRLDAELKSAKSAEELAGQKYDKLSQENMKVRAELIQKKAALEALKTKNPADSAPAKQTDDNSARQVQELQDQIEELKDRLRKTQDELETTKSLNTKLEDEVPKIREMLAQRIQDISTKNSKPAEPTPAPARPASPVRTRPTTTVQPKATAAPSQKNAAENPEMRDSFRSVSVTREDRPTDAKGPSLLVRTKTLLNAYDLAEKERRNIGEKPIVTKNAYNPNEMVFLFRREKGNIDKTQMTALATKFKEDIERNKNPSSLPVTIRMLISDCTGYIFDFNAKPDPESKKLFDSLLQQLFENTMITAVAKKGIMAAIEDYLDIKMTLDIINKYVDSYLIKREFPTELDTALDNLLQKFTNKVLDDLEQAKKVDMTLFLKAIAFQCRRKTLHQPWLGKIVEDMFTKNLISREDLRDCAFTIARLCDKLNGLANQRILYRQLVDAAKYGTFDYKNEPDPATDSYKQGAQSFINSGDLGPR